jgi:hypothetical protein
MVRSAAVMSYGTIENVPAMQPGTPQFPNGAQEVLVHVANTVVKVLLTYLYEDDSKMVMCVCVFFFHQIINIYLHPHDLSFYVIFLFLF